MLEHLKLGSPQRAAVEALLRTNQEMDSVLRWRHCFEELRKIDVGPNVYRFVWDVCFEGWNPIINGPPPMWTPSESEIKQANISKWADELGLDVSQFHDWTIQHRGEFWKQVVNRLGIEFRHVAIVLDESSGPDWATWFPGARLNIVESCFTADESQAAIISQRPGEGLEELTYGQLRKLVNQVSNSVVKAGFQPGDALAVFMPMTRLAAAIYLGVIQAGCTIVSIADSFAPPEIETRLRISNARAVFTYDFQVRAGKRLPLFDQVAEAGDTPAIVIGWDDEPSIADFRLNDQTWQEFLDDSDEFEPYIADSDQTINILFSSGTTGEPKAIPWSHLTPIKCAIDGYCHQDIRPGHVCVWPTNLGWMMGPWLIFASLINRGTIGLYEDVPMGSGFAEFVQDARVNMLGVVPTIVKAWRNNQAMEDADWSSIHTFSSTGESSQQDDMFYLSALAGMKPVIEYCGGTEIGGGYITSFVTEPNVPAAFNTPAVGLSFTILDSENRFTEMGELFIAPPSVGLSTTLLNRDHRSTYYEQTPSVRGFPVLRRHGDHFQTLPSSEVGKPIWAAGGRIDDTMNLGGIKISSAEIERVLNQIDGIKETAAVSQTLDGGPEGLVVFVVFEKGCSESSEGMRHQMNYALKTQLNPLFKISNVQQAEQLPRTASGKVMRRKLRDQLSR